MSQIINNKNVKNHIPSTSNSAHTKTFIQHGLIWQKIALNLTNSLAIVLDEGRDDSAGNQRLRQTIERLAQSTRRLPHTHLQLGLAEHLTDKLAEGARVLCRALQRHVPAEDGAAAERQLVAPAGQRLPARARVHERQLRPAAAQLALLARGARAALHRELEEQRQARARAWLHVGPDKELAQVAGGRVVAEVAVDTGK